MKTFCMMTKLSDICGRADYISEKSQMEKFVVASASIDWKPYADYEKANKKTVEPNNEGRELVIALPNEWGGFFKKGFFGNAKLMEKAQSIAEKAVGKSTDMQWAVHWNEKKSNLHLHVIFSERAKTGEFGTWDRDIYRTDDGRVARNKSDRAKYVDGKVKPPVHRKGDLRGGFTAKNAMYGQRWWLQKTKEELRDEFERMGVKMERQGLLHEYHEGRGKRSEKIKPVNARIRAVNAAFEVYRDKLLDGHEMTRERLAGLRLDALLAINRGEVYDFGSAEKEIPPVKTNTLPPTHQDEVVKSKKQRAYKPVKTTAMVYNQTRKIISKNGSYVLTGRPASENLSTVMDRINGSVTKFREARKKADSTPFYKPTLRKKYQTVMDSEIYKLSVEMENLTDKRNSHLGLQFDKEKGLVSQASWLVRVTIPDMLPDIEERQRALHGMEIERRRRERDATLGRIKTADREELRQIELNLIIDDYSQPVYDAIEKRRNTIERLVKMNTPETKQIKPGWQEVKARATAKLSAELPQIKNPRDENER